MNNHRANCSGIAVIGGDVFGMAAPGWNWS
jgi:hypothetical protein